VAAALEGLAEFVSAQELHAGCAAGRRGGLATVYRTLQNLAEDGEVDVLRAGDGEAVYRRCSSGHHHHLVCRNCRRTVEVDSTPSSAGPAGGEENGFADVDHVLEVFGTCRSAPALPRRRLALLAASARAERRPRLTRTISWRQASGSAT
jgi:Fur family ferric uptake transcriptional regulator